jgi:pimeloyl-ACP methyl ester carboxylesterase
MMEIDGQSIEDLRIKGRLHPDWVIVLLHEGLGSVALWRDFPQQLAKRTGCSVFAYSRLGYGRSDGIELPRPLDFMHQEAKNFLPAVLAQLPENNVVLLGHSDGGSIASIYAGRDEDPRLRSLILMAPHFFVEPISVKAIGEAKTSFEEDDLRTKLKKYHGSNVDTAFWGWCNTWLHSEFRHWNIERFISGVSVPTLFLQGWQDAYGTARQAEAFQTKATCETIIQMITDCGHHPFLEQKTKTLDAISQFLEGRPL